MSDDTAALVQHLSRSHPHADFTQCQQARCSQQAKDDKLLQHAEASCSGGAVGVYSVLHTCACSQVQDTRALEVCTAVLD